VLYCGNTGARDVAKVKQITFNDIRKFFWRG
jgi:hypothetical protein